MATPATEQGRRNVAVVAADILPTSHSSEAETTPTRDRDPILDGA